MVLNFILGALMLPGYISILISAFKDSTIKGLSCLIFNPYALYYLLKEKRKTNIFDKIFYVVFTLEIIFLLFILIIVTGVFSQGSTSTSIITILEVFYAILTIIALIGLGSIVLKAIRKSKILVAILSIIFTPVAVVHLIRRKEEANFFEKVFFIVQALNYFALILIMMYLIPKIILNHVTPHIILLVTGLIFTALALIGYVNVIIDAFHNSLTEGILSIIFIPYAFFYVIKKKDKTNIFDFFFFSFIFIGFVVSLVYFYANNLGLIHLGNYLVYFSFALYIATWIVVISESIKNSAIQFVAVIIIPFYWIYYAFTKFFATKSKENFVKYGICVSLPLLAISMVLIIP